MESNSDAKATAQTGLGVDFSLLQAHGFIRNIDVRPREKKDTMWKFQLRFIDENNVEQLDETWYSGFKEPPAMNGDYIVFKYKQNGIYFNVKEIIDIKYTHGDATAQDQKMLAEINENLKKEDVQVEIDTPTIVSEPVHTELSKPYLALLLNATIHLCIKRNTVSDEEIKSQYNRFIQIL